MSWGLVAIGGAGLAGAWLGSESSKNAAAIQQQGAQQGIASQEAMFNKGLELQQPYREAGYGAVEGLQNMADPAQRGQMLNDFYAGDEYKAMQGQEEEQQLRNSAATGGLRGGGNRAALASISPMIGQQYMSNQQNQLTGLANLGMGAASQGAQGAQFFGQQQSALQQQSAQAQAQNALAQGNIWGDTLSSLGGLAYNKWG